MRTSVRLDYRFNGDVTSVERKGDRITLNIANWRPLSFTPKTAALADAVMALAGPGAALDRLVAIAAGAEAAFDYYIERFTRGRLLAWTIADGMGELARVEALASRWRPRSDPPPPGDLHLCRFAYLRRDDGRGRPRLWALRARASSWRPRGLAALAELLADATAGDAGQSRRVAVADGLSRPRPAGRKRGPALLGVS